jgi:hypothetical protein
MKTPQKLLLTVAFSTLLAGAASAQVTSSFLGNGNSGFGGVIGTGNLTVSSFADGNLTFSLVKGAGNFTDAVVIYIDSVSGGFGNTTSFNDQQDPLRSAISGASGGTTGMDANTRSILQFNTGFNADYAIALNSEYGGLWQLAAGGNNSLVFNSGVNLTPTGTQTNTSYGFNTNVSNIGLSANSGESFKFVATYLNAGNSFRSDEAIGFNIAGDNPGNGGIGNYPTTTATSESTFTTIPEPSTYALIALGAAFLLWRVRRRVTSGA